MEENVHLLKRYRVLITLVFILLFLVIGCWLVKKRDANKTEARKDGVLRQLDLRKK